MRAVAAFLLFTAAAQAQPIIGPEVIWRTTSPAPTFQPSPQAARIEPDGDGFVVAWNEVDDGVSRAYAGRMDAGGRLIAPGVHTDGAAGAVSIAPFGDRYLAAWLEPDPSDARPLLVTAALDREFHLLGARVIGLTSGPPIVRTMSSMPYIASGGFLYEVDRDGAPVVVYDIPRPIDDVATFDGQVGYVFHTSSFIYNVGITWLYRLTTGTIAPFPGNDSPAAIASNGNSNFLVVWTENRPRAMKGSLFGTTFKPFVISTRVTQFDRLSQPQVAWDGVRWVVVWANDNSMEGAVIGPDLAVTPFTVSSGGVHPAIASARPGRFIVTYEIVGFDQRRLASRIIDFTPPPDRGRAVR
jgi:hypothetical protein